MTTIISAVTGASYYINDEEPIVYELSDYTYAVENFVDSVAQSKLYKHSDALATYVASTNPVWAAEAVAFVAWRDQVWGFVYSLWAAPPDPVPTPEELITLLPEIEWPE